MSCREMNPYRDVRQASCRKSSIEASLFSIELSLYAMQDRRLQLAEECPQLKASMLLHRY